MAMVMRVVGDKESNGDGGKINGDSDKGGGRATGDGDGNKGGRQAMAMVMKRVMATAMRVGGNKEGNGNGRQRQQI